MNFLAFGINHKSAPIAVRDSVAVAADLVQQKLEQLIDGEILCEGVLLSTCNRTEIFAFSAAPEKAREHCRNFFEQLRAGKDRSRGPGAAIKPGGAAHPADTWDAAPSAAAENGGLERYAHCYLNAEALEYLFAVICGLDSMALGETQIAGQVREAYDVARLANRSGFHCNRLFEKAFHVNKRVRTETAVGERSNSISRLAVRLARERFADLSQITVLMIGASKMNEICLGLLREAGVREIKIANHNLCNATRLAQEHNQTVLLWNDLYRGLAEVDLVITATAAPHPVIYYEPLKEALAQRGGRLLKIIDMAVPRDVEPKIAELPNVNLYNIDDLEQAEFETSTELRREIEAAHRIIAEERAEFETWLRSLDSQAVIAGLQQEYDELRGAELNRLRNKLGAINDADWDEIIRFSNRLMGKFLHQPLSHLRNPNGANPAATLESVRNLFDLKR